MYRRLDSLRYRGRGRIFINESSQIKEPTTDEPQTGQSAVPENDARKTMLARIREHLAASAPFDKVHHEQHETGATPTAGRAVSQPANSDPVDRFRAALESVNGNCIVVPDEAAAAASLKQIIDLYSPRRIAVSDSPLVQRLMRQVDCQAAVVADAAAEVLFDCDAGITGAQWAIAETGTLVLEAKSERHRLVSLVPPVHIALVAAGGIRETMADVLELISCSGELSRVVTFVTGPSRTSDIELTLAIGVHGPGKLHVIVIRDLQQTV